jgi:hypothetical protein
MLKTIRNIFRRKSFKEKGETQEEFNKKDIEKFNNCFECKYFQIKSAPYCKYWKAYIYYFKACKYFNK